MKKRVTTVNGSQTFIFKSRCKFCKSGPKYVYYLLNKMVSTDTLYMIKDFYEGMGKDSSVADDYYVDYTVKNRSFIPSYMFDSRSSSLQKTRPRAMAHTGTPSQPTGMQAPKALPLSVRAMKTLPGQEMRATGS